MFKNIRAKFLVGYSVITIAFTAILMSVVYLTERHQLAELALNNSMVLSGLHADLISSELLARVNVLEAVRAQVVQANGDVDQIVSELDTLMNLAHTRFLHVAYVDDEFNITDYKGVSESARDRPFVNDSRWFTQSYHITPAIIGRYTHIPIVSIGVRITNDDGEWTGTLLAPCR